MEVQQVVTDETRGSAPVSIGELARSTGIAVRTIRFYCDEGILESSRSPGGHRMFDVGSATERLQLVRRLRTLGLGWDSITEVLRGERSIGEAVAAESARVDSEFRSLAWRRAALRAVESAGPAHRADRLALLAAAEDGTAAHDRLLHFWRRILAPIHRRHVHMWVCWNVPQPPADPTVDQVVAYAELTALAVDPGMNAAVRRQYWRHHPESIRDRRGLYLDMGHLMRDVVPLVSQGVAPHVGSELDRFVAAHAAARGERDSPDFRARLLIGATDDDPRIHRYWTLTDRLLGDRITVGRAHHWLYDALTHSTDPRARRRSGS
ncbi:MerR family transcriptional regulator [Nocardia seriolae]|uniref:MerR family transcriptional regulator n=1 Tax=Nocardia seriolae TaxID=37332 RepID=UPI0027B8BCED|nr:MerR family transcriptional regulator [Nocardia seriolae]